MLLEEKQKGDPHQSGLVLVSQCGEQFLKVSDSLPAGFIVYFRKHCHCWDGRTY